MLFSRTANLLRELARIVNHKNSQNHKFPLTLTFCRDMGSRKFKITVDELEDDFFIDAQGVKWIRARESEKSDLTS